MPRRALLGSLCAALAALAASGCAERLKQAPPPAKPAARLLVTVDFGSRELKAERVAPDQTVIAALQGAARVQTSYGGDFVDAIDGLSGSPGRHRGWLYFVNGIEADIGGAGVTLRVGDEAWWDYRDWVPYIHVPAVVGAWPEPFVHGYGGKRPDVAADPPLDAVLRRAGAHVVTGTASYRVLVGADAALRARDAAFRRAASDPQASGLTAWIAHGRVLAWDAARAKAVRVPGATAVVAATQTGDGSGSGVVLVVDGLDAAAAARAATTVAADPGLLAHRYAVCLDAQGRAVCAGGLGVIS
jgi:hypothetical protein